MALSVALPGVWLSQIEASPPRTSCKRSAQEWIATNPTLTPSGSSQQSAGLVHSAPQVLPVGVMPYEARSHTLDRKPFGRHTSPSEQSVASWHVSPRCLWVIGGPVPASPVLIPFAVQRCAKQARPLLQSARRVQ